MAKHKRGGFYKLRIMADVTNWGGVLLDREILNNLKVGDTVRILFEPLGESRYVEITHVLSGGYFKGFVDDPYNGIYCNICKEESMKKGKPLHHCENMWRCQFNCHLDCLKKHPDMVCHCNKNEFKIVPWMQYLLNGSIIIFKKNNISEIPNWSKNTERLIEVYRNKENYGYLVTGTR